MSFPISVYAFNSIADSLATLPREYRPGFQNARQKVQLEEIDRILARENVKTVVAEEYVDRHFIHDFCGHYGSCYHDYPKKCIRLHFFEKVFSQEDFLRHIAGNRPDANGFGKYAGFIVIRPIPGAILSNVSLQAPLAIENSHFITKSRTVHLCGMELTVETVPFQEQDHAISACATSALWMALQAAPGFYPHTVPSPHELTENAHKVFVDGGKSNEVSKGLTVSQMACALKEEKLNPLTCLPFSTSYAKALLRAYLNIGIPVLLGIELYFRSDDTYIKNSRIIGCHAIVALGYECGGIIEAFDSPEMLDSDSENVPDLFLEASAITTFYCHDDQIGPYSGMGIPNEYALGMSSEWGRIYGKEDVNAKIISVILPCNPKIRIRFANIYEFVKAMNIQLSAYYNLLGGHLSWDIRLENVCELKKHIRSESTLDPESRARLLTMSLPRYIWVVDQFYNEVV